MEIITPAKIESIVWQGELVPPSSNMMREMKTKERPPTAAVGKPEVWPLEKILEVQPDSKWVPPIGKRKYWLVRLACTLHDPSGLRKITEAQQTLSLRPENEAYAYSLFPDRLEVEDKAEFNIGLSLEAKFVKGEAGTKIEYIKVFPVIKSYGIGSSDVRWEFRNHPKHPIEGDQCVYAVISADEKARGITASVDLRATIQTKLGPVPFSLPKEVVDETKFAIG